MRPFQQFQFTFQKTALANHSIRSEITPPISAYNKGGILINNPTVQFRRYKMSHTKSWSGHDQGASIKRAKRARYLY